MEQVLLHELTMNRPSDSLINICVCVPVKCVYVYTSK